MAKTENRNPSITDFRGRLLLLFTLMALALILVAWRQMHEPLANAAPGDRLWDIEINIQAEAESKKSLVDIVMPFNTRYLRVIGKSISHPGWNQQFIQAEGDRPVRKIRLMAARTGLLSAQLSLSVHQRAVPGLAVDPANNPLKAEIRELHLGDHPLLQITDPSVVALVDQLSSSLTEDGSLVDLIYQWVHGLRQRHGDGLLKVPEILLSKQVNRQERAYTMIALCRAARIPARLVKGLVLTEMENASLHHWVEVYTGNRWRPYDPVNGYSVMLPSNYLPFTKSNINVVSFTAASSGKVAYVVANADPLLEIPESTGNDWREVFDLSRLTLDTRITLAPLMLIPFGVLLTTLLRERFGVRMYGVFTPALLALSLNYVPWVSALLILSVVLILGVLGRSIMPNEMGRSPRLSIVLTLVVLGIAGSASLMEFFGMSFGGQLVLLPVVILSSLVDRFYSVLEDNGLHIALVRLGWTLAAAVVCIPIISFEALGHLMIRYPELHLITLAAVLAVSMKARRVS